MNALIDEDLHKSLANVLSNLGFNVFDVRDHGLRGKADIEIFKFAKGNKAVLFSADLGFSNILNFPLGSHSGIVILRFPNELSTGYINKAVKSALSKLRKNDYSGNLIIISLSGIRIKRQKLNKN
ncbi:MAG: DUF5615 family PIN-like protein [Candidatus Levybacteria bacterium]|nr:DUF5615 family PIN-like protein [Candidatus Levybacteria bacterium]